jgi:hypothetical protein
MAEILQMAQQAQIAERTEVFVQVVEVFLQVMELRVLVHAADEEQGLYQEWLKIKGDLQPVIDQLGEEHEALRHLSLDLESAIVARNSVRALAVMTRMVDAFSSHSGHEEEVLRSILPERSKRE